MAIESKPLFHPEVMRQQMRSFSDLVNQAYALTRSEIALMWQTAPPRMPIPPANTAALHTLSCPRNT